MRRYFWNLLFFITFTDAQAQTLRLPVILENTESYTLNKTLTDLILPSVSTPAAPLGSTQNCKCSLGCTVLPVALLSFDGQRTSVETVLLKWETTNEVQNKGFEVERSLGVTGVFSYVDFVPAQVDFSVKKKYAFNDFNNYEGISYYRLKQLDQDNRFTYSKIIAVKGFNGTASLKLYPNPAATNMVTEIYFTKSGTAKLWLLDATQKLLLVRTISYNKGINLINVPVASLSSGLYFIKIISADNDLLNGKFMKQ